MQGFLPAGWHGILPLKINDNKYKHMKCICIKAEKINYLLL